MESILTIENKIKDMGYLVVKPIKVLPSYYELEDGSILEALTRIESVIKDKNNPIGFFINTSNTTKVYTHAENRDPTKFESFTAADLASGIVDQDVESKELFSDYSEYELSNDIVVKIKTIVSQIQKTKFYSQDGEPVYTVSITPVMKHINKK